MTRTLGAVEGAGSSADAHVRDVVWTMLGARRQKPAELALRLGISKSSIYSRLSGKTVFSVGEVAAMSEHFDLPPSVFFAGNDALIIGRGAVQPTMQKVTRPAAPHGVPLRTRPTGRLSLVAA